MIKGALLPKALTYSLFRGSIVYQFDLEGVFDMLLEAFVEKIGLSPEAADAVLAFDISEGEEAFLLELFNNKFEEFEEKVRENNDPNRLALCLITRFAAKSMEQWYKKGIPEDIAVDTMRDIAIWCNRYYDRTGKVGLIEWKWFIIHIGVNLFRLGRLQFEPILCKEDITLPDGTFFSKGTPVLSVHIPRGDGFTPESIRASFEASKKFFPKYLGKSYDTYVCTSWLLAPQLEGMISDTSTIANFRKYFTVYGEVLGYSQAEDYVFLNVLEDKTKYAEDTSLQRNLKKFLVDGGEIGMGKAIAKY